MGPLCSNSSSLLSILVDLSNAQRKGCVLGDGCCIRVKIKIKKKKSGGLLALEIGRYVM